MGNNKLLVEERSRDIGRFRVGRLLPFREKRMVGPFCFIDHMGPVEFGRGQAFDVDQHPHIGLCTLTYLLEGEIEHADSTGARQRIQAGSVNLMVSGSGVSHTERTPADLRVGQARTLHGYQVWIALPVAEAERAPSFHHIPASDLPRWQEGDLHCTLVAGTAFERTAPVPVFSPLFMVEVVSEFRSILNLAGRVKGEIAIVVVQGTVQDEDQEIEAGNMLISKAEDECALLLHDNTRVLLFGGEAFPEERFLYWNFVSHSRDRIEKAKTDWRERRFPNVPGDDTYIPLPQ